MRLRAYAHLPHAYMRKCVHAYICAFTHVCISADAFMGMCIIWDYACSLLRMCLYSHVHVRAYAHVYICACVYIRLRVYAIVPLCAYAHARVTTGGGASAVEARRDFVVYVFSRPRKPVMEDQRLRRIISFRETTCFH